MSSKIKGKVPDHDLSNLPKSDIHVWFYEYFLVKSYKFQKNPTSSANILKFSSQIPRTGSQWFEFNILSKISNSYCDYFSYCRSIQYVSPRFWEPACTYTWQPQVLNIEASRYPTIFWLLFQTTHKINEWGVSRIRRVHSHGKPTIKMDYSNFPYLSLY